jgi:hypothetical protein
VRNCHTMEEERRATKQLKVAIIGGGPVSWHKSAVETYTLERQCYVASIRQCLGTAKIRTSATSDDSIVV